jgi:aryl-alcohol dehydrogenase-like predicted oxidoreductase
VGLLAYSNGFWDLIRKILDGEKHNARINLFPQFARYNAPSALKRQSYIRKLRVKWVNFNRVVSGIYRTTIFVTSTIIGATTMEQLKENIDSIKVSLSDEILKAIDEVQAIILIRRRNKPYSYNYQKSPIVIWIGLFLF